MNMKLFRKALCLLLVLTSLISTVSASSVVNTSANSYISQTYASNLSVSTDIITSLYDAPSSSGTLKHTIKKDTQLKAVALIRNTSDEYWYEVQYYDQNLYVLATATTMLSHLTGDISVKNLQSPAVLKYGSGFPIGGEVTSVYNNIGEIRASLYKGQDLTREPALTSADDVNGNYYNLTSSTVDTNLWFNLLEAGNYTYVVEAEAVSYYIDDNDSLKASAIPVFVEKKQCVVTNASNPNPALHHGIDVSQWNGTIDWATVSSQVDFVFMRASWEETADTKFTYNASGCETYGIPYGVYVYSYAETEAEAIGEANYVLSLVDGYNLTLPIYFDFEDECQMNLSTSMKKAVVKAFCDTIYAAGYQPGIYTYKWVLDSVLTDSYFKTLPTWVPEINGASYTSYTGGVTMWQYSWTGKFNGMSGDVDCNYMYAELPNTNSSDSSYLKKCTYYPSNLNIKLNDDANVRQYPSTDYSLLKTLNQGDTVHVTGLYKNTYGNYWYQIETGGVTGYIGSEYGDIVEYLYNDISIQNPSMATNLDLGKGYYIEGELSSVYNNLNTINARVYTGEDTSATPVLCSSYSPDSKSYSLYKSKVDYGLAFGSQSTGYYTYEVSVDVINYSAKGTSLSSQSKNVVLWTAPYTVNNADITPPASTACTHVVVTQPYKAPTCTAEGITEGSYCSQCGVVFATQTPIEATGHNYEPTVHPATCIDFKHTDYTCLNCSDSYSITEGNNYSEWTETKPEGVDDSLIETKTQYRYSQYEMVKNYLTSMEGYTLINKEWESQGQQTQECVKEWPDGFNTSHALYSQYNKTPASDKTDTYYTKQELNSESIVGYIYYHWCSGLYNDGPYNRTTSKTQTDFYKAFHSFYSTKSPSESEREASDGSVIYSNLSCCGDSYWYYNIPVYKQTYTNYKALYTHSIWHPYTQWSDTEVTASWDRTVETRTLYRTIDPGALGDHTYSNGKCTVCSQPQPDEEMCLFGYINGVDYCDEKDYKELEAYCFKDGKLVTTFTEDSYVGVKTANNKRFYMTNGYPTDHVTSVMLYNTDVLENNADKLFVPKGREITFTLEKCNNDTYILSYTAAPCLHSKHTTSGECVNCGEVVEHNFTYGGCTVCGTSCSHNYKNGVCKICKWACTHKDFENGICNDCDIACTHYFKNGSCVICNTVCSHDYKDGMCTICNDKCTSHNYVDSICQICGKDETYFYLAGEINGKEATGTDYVFEDGCVTVQFTKASYVHIKNSDNVSYKSACDYGDNIYLSLLYKEDYLSDAGFDLFVPANSKLKFSIIDQNDDIITLSITEIVCSHTQHTTTGICKECSLEVPHSFNSKGVCTVCKTSCTHSFTDGVCSVCGYNCDHSFHNGVCTTCKLVCTHTFTDGICTKCGALCDHSYNDGECTDCHLPCEHDIENGTCQICNKTFTYTLAGYINGEHIGVESDFDTTDAFVFDNMTTTLTTTEDSYVFVKTTDNDCLYLAKDKTTDNEAVLFNSDTVSAQEMLFVPSGTEVEFTLSFGESDTLVLKYDIVSCSHINRNSGGVCTVCSDVQPVPSTDLKYAVLSIEDELVYTIYFDTTNMDSVTTENMGVAIFESADSKGTIDTASKILNNVRIENGYFAVDTEAMYAHKIADNIYFKAFAILDDSSVVYSDIMSFSGARYATSVINNPVSSPEEKALMVSLLNYGAELQKYYGYNTDSLMNRKLTKEQKVYACEYSPAMVEKTDKVTDEKVGEFIKTGQGASFYPVVRFDKELFGFDCILKAKDAQSYAYFYYWEEDDFANADVLSADNATGSFPFANINGEYNIGISAITAKELNSSLYMAIVYETQDGTYSSGVLAYSLAEYLAAEVENANSQNCELAKAALVYGYYAKNFFTY